MAKRILALLLVTVFTFSLAACGGDKEVVSSTAGDSQVVSEVESKVESVASEDAQPLLQHQAKVAKNLTR